MPTGLMDFGERLGTASMGGSAGSMAKDITKALIVQGFTQNNQMKMEAMRNGWGISRSKDGKALEYDRNIYQNDMELQMGRAGFEKNERTTAEKQVRVSMGLMKTEATLLQLYKKFTDAGESPQAVIELGNKLKAIYTQDEVDGVRNPFKAKGFKPLDLEKLYADQSEAKNTLITNLLVAEAGAKQGDWNSYVFLKAARGTNPKLLKELNIDLEKTLAGFQENRPLRAAQQAEDVSKAGQIAGATAGANVSLQDKRRTYVDPETQKVIQEEYLFNPKTGAKQITNKYEYPVGTRVVGYDSEGNAIVETTRGPTQTTTQPAGLSRPASEKLRQDEASVTLTVNTIRQVQDIVGQDPSVIGAVGKAQRFIDSASAQLMTASKMAGGSSIVKGRIGNDSQLLNPNEYDFRSFAPGATKSAQVKSLLVKLAYLRARTNDPQGRLSKEDVEMALSEIGGATGSPAQMNAVLNMIADNVQTEYALRYEVLTRQPYQGAGQTAAPPPVKKTIRYDAQGNRID